MWGITADRSLQSPVFEICMNLGRQWGGREGRIDIQAMVWTFQGPPEPPATSGPWDSSSNSSSAPWVDVCLVGTLCKHGASTKTTGSVSSECSAREQPLCQGGWAAGNSWVCPLGESTWSKPQFGPVSMGPGAINESPGSSFPALLTSRRSTAPPAGLRWLLFVLSSLLNGK